MSTARDFQVAMACEQLKDLAVRRGVSCQVCDRPDAKNLGTWAIADQLGRKLGVPEGKTRMMGYKLCNRCAKKAARGHKWTQRFIEASIVARMTGGDIVYLDKDGMPDVEGSIA